MASDIRAVLIVLIAVGMFALGTWFGVNLNGGCQCDARTQDHQSDHHHGTPGPHGMAPIGSVAK